MNLIRARLPAAAAQRGYVSFNLLCLSSCRCDIDLVFIELIGSIVVTHETLMDVRKHRTVWVETGESFVDGLDQLKRDLTSWFLDHEQGSLVSSNNVLRFEVKWKQVFLHFSQVSNLLEVFLTFLIDAAIFLIRDIKSRKLQMEYLLQVLIVSIQSIFVTTS